MNPLDTIFSQSMDIMSKALNLRLAKQEVHASNLANIDTPKYRFQDLNFEKALQRALPKVKNEMAMTTTDPKHIGARDLESAYSAAKTSLEPTPYGVSDDGNANMDIDQEMSKLVKNQLMYNATIQILAKKFEGLQWAISEGGK